MLEKTTTKNPTSFQYYGYSIKSREMDNCPFWLQNCQSETFFKQT